MPEAVEPTIKETPALTLLDGCIGWPVMAGGFVRLDPFHIRAFGIQPATENGVPGWCVWCDIGGSQGPFQLFYREQDKALREFVVIQQSKVRH
jgi:hypothetical protein